jgi:hypothetical protein
MENSGPTRPESDEVVAISDSDFTVQFSLDVNDVVETGTLISETPGRLTREQLALVPTPLATVIPLPVLGRLTRDNLRTLPISILKEPRRAMI